MSPPTLISSLRLLLLLQFSTRILTFSLNNLALLRLVPPSAIAIAGVRFELVCGTVLTVCREAVKGVVLRTGGAGHHPRMNRNLMRLPLIGGIILVSMLVPFLSTDPTQPHYNLSLSLHLISTLLELLTTPSYLSLPLNVRVRAEGLASVLRAVGTVGWLVAADARGGEAMREQQALVAFGVGQIAWAVGLVGVYGVEEAKIGGPWWHKWIPVMERGDKARSLPHGGEKDGDAKLGFEGMPSTIATASLLPPDTPLLLLTLTAHAGLKHVLTEADRIVLGWVVGQGRGTAGRGKANEGLDDMAGYAVAGNYASLIARVIFQPVEESTRLYFSKALSQQQVKDEEKPQDKTAPRHIFILLIRSCLLLALLCPAFIPPALPFVLPYILPARYLSTSAPSTLLTYLTVYIPILALNGILEAVFSVTASSGGVANQGIVMIACTGAFGAALLIMKEARDAGWLGVGMESCLVLANAVQMGLRIGYAWIHARQVFRDGRSLSVRRVLPKWRTLGAVVFAAMALRWLVDGLKPGRVVDLAKVAGGGGALGLGCLWVYYVDERTAWLQASMGAKRKTT